MIRTPHFELPYFQDGDFFTALDDEERSVAIDHLLKALADVIDDGVISGWEINDEGGITVSITAGKGFISGKYSRSINDMDLVLADNATNYIYITRNSNVIDGHSTPSDIVSIDFTDVTAPNAPADFSAEEVESRRVLLSWSPNTESDFSSYKLERKKTVDVLYGDLGSVSTATGSGGKVYYEDTDINPDTSYDYRISAFDVSGNQSSYSSLTTVSEEDLVPPPEVTELTLRVSNASFNVYWEPVLDVEDFDSYIVILNKLDESGNTLTSDTIDVGTNLYYRKIGLSNNVPYRVTVKTKDIYGNISKGVVRDFTPVFFPGPLEVSAITYSVTNIGRPNPVTPQVSLLWSASASSDIVGYNIYIIEDGVASEKIPVGNYLARDVFIYPARQDSALVNKIFSDKKDYIIKITAEDTGGKESNGAFIKIFIPDYTPPNDAKNLRATIGDSQVNFTWDSSDSIDFDHYEFHQWKIADESSFTETATYSAFASNTFTLDSPLTKSFPVGSWVDLSSPPSSGSPDKKMILTAAANIGDMTLECDFIPAYFSQMGSVVVTASPSHVEFSGRNSYSVTGLDNSALYKFTLISVDSSDIRSKGVSVNATPLEEFFELESPDLISQKSINAEAVISWTEVSGVEGYIVYRAGPIPWIETAAPDADFVAHATVPSATQTEIVDTGLENGSRYAYVVVSYVGSQESEFNGNQQVIASPLDTTAPEAPINPTLTGVSGSVTVGWSLPTDITSIEGWEIYRSTHKYYGYELVDSVPFSVTSYVDSGLKDGVKYYYYIRSFSNTVDISSSLSASVPTSSIFVGSVVTEAGDITTISPARSIIANLEKTVVSLTNEFIRTHKHKATSDGEFSATRDSALQINLSKDEDVVGFSTVDYRSYVSAKDIESAENYVVLINGMTSSVLYDVDFENDTIVFDQQIYLEDDEGSLYGEPPEIALRYLNKREVQGILDSRFIADIDASKIVSGLINRGLLPEISHRGRISEEAAARKYSMGSRNNILYDLSVTSYIINGETVKISIGSPTVFYNFFTYGGNLYGSSNLGFMKSEDNGITWELSTSFAEVVRRVYQQQNGEGFYFAVGQKSVYISSNFKTWFSMAGTAAVNIIHDIVEDLDGNVYIATDTGVYVYDQEFVLSYKFSPATLITIDSISSEIYSIINTSGLNVVVSTEDGLFRTSDKGVTWAKISAAGPFVKMRHFGSKIIGIDPDSGFLYESTDDAVTWKLVSGFEDLSRDSVFEVISNRLYFSTDEGPYYSDDLGTPVRIGGDFNSKLSKQGVRAINGNSKTNVLISFDNAIYRFKDGRTHLWSESSGVIPSVYKNSELLKSGYYYDSNRNNLYFEWKSLYDDRLQIATTYDEYTMVNGGWQDIDSDDVVVDLFINGVKIGSIQSSAVEEANIETDDGNTINKKYVFSYGAENTVTVNSEDGKVEVYGPQFSKLDEVKVSVQNVAFTEEGENTHVGIQDALDKKNVGLPYCLSNVYLDSMLQMGLSAEHNFIESVQTNSPYPYAVNRIVRSFNSELINSEFFIFGRKFYDVFNSTIDYDEIEHNKEIQTSPFDINFIKEVGDETWAATDIGIYVLNAARNDVDRKIEVVSGQDMNVTGIYEDSSHVYVVANNDLYRSADSGVTWTKNKGFGLGAKSFEINAIRNVLLISASDGVYFTTKDSEEWVNGTFFDTSNTAVTIVENIDSLVVFDFAFCLVGNKVYRSVNGSIWNEVYDFADTEIAGINASKLVLYRNNILALTNKGLYSDLGSLKFFTNSFFNKIPLESPDVTVSIKSVSAGGNRILLIAGKNTLYSSDDYGKNWAKQTISAVDFIDICHNWPEVRLTISAITKMENDGVPSSVTVKLNPIIGILYPTQNALSNAVSLLLTDIEYRNHISTILLYSHIYSDSTEILSSMAEIYERDLTTSFAFSFNLEESDRVFENDLRQPLDVAESFNKVSVYLVPVKYGNTDYSVTLTLYGADSNNNIITGPLSSDIKDGDEIFNPGWYNFRVSYSGLPSRMVLVMKQNYGDNNNMVKWAYTSQYDYNGIKNGVEQNNAYAFSLWKYVDAVDIEAQTVTSLPAIDAAQSPIIGSGEFKNTVFENSKVKLSSDEKMVAVIVDESGSMTWNDKDGDRFSLIEDYVGDLNAIYPAELKYTLVTYGGKILSSIKSEVIHESERDVYGSSFRVVRREDRYPVTPLDGTIVADTSLNVAKDDTVVSGGTYYYGVFNIRDDTIYSSGQFDKIDANERIVPLAVSNIELENNVVKEIIGSPAAEKDTGKRKIDIRFKVIENFAAHYSAVRIVRKACYDEEDAIENVNDGELVYEGAVTVGENKVTDDFGGTSDPINGIEYCYAIFTKNSVGNYCLPQNAVQDKILIPSVWREWEYDTAYNSTYIPSEFTTAPSEVEDFAVEAGYGQNMLSWTIPSGDTAVGVVVYVDESATPQENELNFAHAAATQPEDSAATASGSTSASSSAGTKIYEGEGTFFVHRRLENGRKYFYRIYTFDRVRTLSDGNTIGEGAPSEEIDDDFPPPDTSGFYAEIFNDETIILRWELEKFEPVPTYYFDDLIKIRSYALDESGVPIGEIEDFQYEIVSAERLPIPPTAWEDPLAGPEEKESIPSDDYLFVPDAKSFAGEIRANMSIFLGNLTSLSGYEYYSILAKSKYSLEGDDDSSFTEYVLESNEVGMTFRNPVGASANNKFPSTQKIAKRVRNVTSDGEVIVKTIYVDGVYSRSGKSYFGEIHLKFKDAALTDEDSVTVTAQIYNLDRYRKINELETVAVWKQEPSTSFFLASNDIRIVTQEVQKNVKVGDGTEVSTDTELQSVGVFQVLPTYNFGEINIVFDVNINGYTAQVEHILEIKSILNISLSAGGPVADGRSVMEQTASAYIGPPSFDIRNKDARTPVPDGVLVKWELNKVLFGKDRPFYSIETIPLGGIYSTIRDGTARNVFFGPASDVEIHYVIDSETGLPERVGEKYEIVASIVYDGMSQVEREEVMLWPLSTTGTLYNFYMTNGGEIGGITIFADGEKSSTVEIHGDPLITAGEGGAKFYDCITGQGNSYIPLFPGQKVELDDLDIDIQGDYAASYTYNGVEYSNLSDIPIVLDENSQAEFEVKINAFVGPPPEKGPSFNSGSDSAEAIIINPCYGVVPKADDYPPKAVVFGTAQTTLGGISVTMGGGGNQTNGLPPVVIILTEPLVMNFRRMVSNAKTVLNPPNDGINSTDISFDVSFSGETVPDGTQVSFELLYGDTTTKKGKGESATKSIGEINALPAEQRRLYYGGFSSYAELLEEVSLEETTGITRVEDEKSVVSAILSPTKVTKDVEFTLVATATYDKLGTISRSVQKKQVLKFRGRPEATEEGDGISVYEATVERYDPVADAWVNMDKMNTGKSGHLSEYDSSTGKLYVSGGLNDSGILDTTEEFTYTNIDKSADSEGSYGAWVVKDGLPTYPRSFCQSVIKDGVIYALGGFGFNPFGTTTGNNSFPLCEKYDISSDTWTVLAEMPTPVSHGVAGLIGDNIYVFSGLKKMKPVSGGHTFDEFNDTILKYSITNDEWTVLEELDVTGNILRRISPFSYVKSGKIYVYGGIRSEFDHKDPSSALMVTSLVEIDVSDENNIILTEIAYTGDPIDRFRGGSYALFGDDLFVVGGSGNKFVTVAGEERLIGTDTLRAVESLDTATNTWTTYKNLARMKKERHSLSVMHDSEYVYASGGVSSGYEEGKLIITTSLSKDRMRADGKDEVSVNMELVDVTGEPAPDGVKVVMSGFVLVSVGEEEDAEKVPSDTPAASEDISDDNRTVSQLSDRVSVYPVIFSSREIFTVDGAASSIALPRSEDPMEALSALYQYTSGKDDVIGQVFSEDEGEEGVALSPKKTEFKVEPGVERSLYSIVIESLIEDDFYSGGTDTGAALESNMDKIIKRKSGNNTTTTDSVIGDIFSLSSSSSRFQPESPTLEVYNNIGWIPHVDETYGVTDYDGFIDNLNKVKQRIPFGGSPHWDAVVSTAQNILKDDDYRGIGKIIIDVSDNEENLSAYTIDDVISQLHLVDGYQNTPIFTNSFVVAKPPSLSARANRADTVDLEKISGETGGLSHTILDESYIPMIVRRMKVGSVGAIGSGTYIQIFDLESIVTVTDIRANFELYDFTDGWVEIQYSTDGINYTLLNEIIEANTDEVVSFSARYVKFVVTLSSEFGDADLAVPSPPPAFLDIEFGYSLPRKQYIFTYATTANSFIRQIYMTVNGNVPLSSIVRSGITNSTSTNWDDYSSKYQQAVGQRGRIVTLDSSLSLLNLSEDISSGGRTQFNKKTRSEIEAKFVRQKEEEYGKVIDRIIIAEDVSETSDGQTKLIFSDGTELLIDEAPDYRSASDVVSITEKDQTKYTTSGTILNYNFLNSEDGYIYTSSYGSWQPEAVVNVYRNGIVVAEAEYVKFQHKGVVKFHERQDLADNMAVEIALSPEFRVGFEVTNKDKRVSAVLDEFAYMYNSNYVRSSNLFNGAPTATGLSITPVSANPTDTFVANYAYEDPNSEPEKDSSITWYLNDGVVNELQDLKSWDVSDLIKKNLKNGDKIYFTVRPSDGSLYGPLAVSPSLFIGDTPPVITDLLIVPIINFAVVTQYTSSVDLGVSYNYSDSRGRAESGTTIEWFLNGDPITFRDVTDPTGVAFVNNQYRTTDDILAIERGNVLQAKVTPSNGVTRGFTYESAEVVIENSAPVLSNVTLTPSSPDVNSILTVSYDFVDRDDDVDATLIRWYNNGELIESLNDRLTVSSEFTAAGESWFADVTPSDGETDGDVIRTSTVTIASR